MSVLSSAACWVAQHTLLTHSRAADADAVSINSQLHEQVACAAAIIVITATQLHQVKITFDEKWNLDIPNTCLLGKMDNSGNLCYLAYLSSGLSILATFALSVLQCCTCNLCGMGLILDGVLGAAGTLMWCAVGLIFNTYHNRPAMQHVPQPQWRLSITVLSFTACALFGIMALAAVYSILKALCCCCSCCGGGSKGQGGRAQVVYRDMEKGHQGQGQFMVR